MSWAPSIGSIFGIRIEVHFLFILFVVVEFLRFVSAGNLWMGLRYFAILIGVVFLHEMGHCFAARSTGGVADRILMWPLGGLAYVAPPHRPGAHLVTAIGGPAVNLFLCLLTGPILVAASGSIAAVPLNPFNLGRSIIPVLTTNSAAILWTYQLFLVSYILLLFNACVPVFPLDGGRILQSILWQRVGYQRSMLLATTIGMIGAVALGCYGLFTQNFLLIGIAVFGYLTCQQESQMAAVDGPLYDVPVASGTDRRRPRGVWGRLRSGTWQRKIRQIAEDEVEVDRILDKIRMHGMQSLTWWEKRFLRKASQRRRQLDEQQTRR